MSRNLTARQREVLALFCSGMSYREVAAELGLSPETINPSLKQSAKRLGCGGKIAREVLLAAAEAAGEIPKRWPPQLPQRQTGERNSGS